MPTRASRRSRFSGRARPRLGRAALALWALVVVAGATLTGFLLTRDEPGADVAAYIEQVNAAQRPFAIRYGSINRAYEALALAPESLSAETPRLREGAAALRETRLKVAAIEPPAEARALRAKLLAFLRQQELVTRELVAVAAYLPKLAAGERPVAAASRTLRTSLRAAATPEAQAGALRRYALALRRAAERLAAVEAPRLLAPTHDAYVRQLEEYASASLALQRAVRAGDQAAVDAAVGRLDAVAAPRSPAAQRDAIAAYNRRVRAVRELGRGVELERLRLERALA